MDDSGELLVVHAFLQRYAADRAQGRVRSAADYATQWPGHAAAIEREFAALEAADDAGPADAGRAKQVGRYTIERELGRGGQAVVYLARDDQLQRTVALKVLPRAHASVAQELRFQREAQTTARLDDSGICPIYEVGQDGDHAFLAMRYVDGETLAARLERARATGSPLPWREVVEWFVRLTASLQRAHAAGVVHRDLKPGNVMLEVSGQPVLLDFGLAVEIDSNAPLLTRSGDLFGTPAYLPPERLLGHSRTADPRWDLWALGVCLYEALTLQRPFASPTLDGLYRAILGEEPVEMRRHRRELPRDLATVVAVCLEKAPERRYQTAADLARDLRAVLAGEPITARPAGALRRFATWHRRHAALATAGWLLLAGLATVIFVQRTMLAEVRQARDEAQGLNDFLVERLLLASTPDRARGTEPTASQILDAASANVREAFPTASRVAAMVYHVLGRANAQLGRHAAAHDAFAAAAAMRTSLLGPDARETLRSRHELAVALQDQDRFDEAEALLAEVHAQLLAAFGEADADSVATRRQQALLQAARGRYAEATAIAREVLELRRRTLPEDDRLVLDAEHVLARFLANQGKRAEAEPVFRRVLAGRRRIHGEDSVLVEKSLTDLATLLHDMASYDRVEAKWAEAEALYAEDLALVRRIYKPTDPSYAVAINNVGTFWQDRIITTGDQAQRTAYAERAEALFRESLALREQIYGAESTRVATTCNNLAMLLVQVRRAAEALPLYDRALAIRTKVLGGDHAETLKTIVNRAYAVMALQGPVAAEPLFAEALAGVQRRTDQDPLLLTIFESAWVRAALDTPKATEVLPAAVTSHGRLVAAYGERSLEARRLAKQIAKVLRQDGRDDEAKTWDARGTAP